MPTEPRLPKWLGYYIAPLLVVPLVLGAHAVEGAWFFGTAAAICICASLGGLWWGEQKGESEGTRAALGCAGTLVLFAIYLLWTFVGARLLFDR
jgi:hypothetical protein